MKFLGSSRVFSMWSFFLVLAFANAAAAQTTYNDRCTDSLEYCRGLNNSVCPFPAGICDYNSFEHCGDLPYTILGVDCTCGDFVVQCDDPTCDYNVVCGEQPLGGDTTPDDTDPLPGCDYDLDSYPCVGRDWGNTSGNEDEQARPDIERFARDVMDNVGADGTDYNLDAENRY
jgi:hypothetical protein